ncbi:toxin glutamine deamidase domain-containing protein [Mycolicibacterium sp. P9-64]|uniref:toxin glutamine deamidase domain-containing protein n=1 Tax=Mycolicibacterium sp. P9-64 TaxID=2024612 RepID=UPI001563E97C|nr:toxin glutamine deamidase domain-containing protein [Mycolicibacterium sp. P9-64]
MGAVTAGGRIEVDPEVLLRAGQKVGWIGAQLDALSTSLGAALGSGIASGWDPAGAHFGLTYGDSAQKFADTLAEAANAFKFSGQRLEATGYNYKNADAGSTIGGGGPMGSVGAAPSETKAVDAPTGPSGAIVPPPPNWWLIEGLLNAIPVIGSVAGAVMTWPTGNPSLMRLTAAQWKNFATGLSAFNDELPALKTALSQQHIPEQGRIQECLGDIGEYLPALSEHATTMATNTDDFANGVQKAQDAIRRLLDRISLDGLWDTVTGIFSGDGLDILQQIADDVGAVLENFQNEVKGIVGLLADLSKALGEALDAFQKWVKPALIATFGDEVGGALADAVTFYTDVQLGLINSVIGTVSGLVSLADVDTLKGMAEMALSVAEDPSKLPGVLENMGKQFIAYDQLTGDHPGRGVGEAAGNIGMLFLPGGAATKTGSIAKGLRYGSKLLEEGRLPRISDIPGLGGGKSLPSVDNLPGAGPGHPGVPEFTPPRIPESLVDPPSAPHAPEAPHTPQELGGSGGPPGGGPPDPPGGRPVGPPDSGPGRADGPAPQSPSSGAGEPPRVSEPTAPTAPSHAPSSGDAPAPAAQHSPESPSPASPHEAGGQSPSEPGPSPTEHSPATPEPSGNGVAEPRPDGNHAPNESHQPTTQGGTGGPGDGTHAPADHQPAHTPAAESPAAHEPSRTDGGQPYEPTHTPGDANTQPQQPAATTPAPMAGGMPMAPHAGGGVHSPSDGPARAQTPEAPARTPESKAPQAGSPETPRTQAPASAGPGPSNSPSAPVNMPSSNTPTAPVSPAATQHLSPTSEASRPGPETSTPKSGDGPRDGAPPAHPTPHDTPSTPAAHQPDPPGSQPNPGAGNTPNQPTNPPGPVGNPADARAFGEHGLDDLEDPAHQTAVENALRDSQGNNLVHADPRTNDYGHLVNDGGDTVAGRSNNCLDCSLSALSSFRGEPTVSVPRYPDELPDGTVDRRSGEQGGLRRAEDWLGSGLLEFKHIPEHTFKNPTIADHFNAVHQYIDNLGPGSSALVVNGWHARDFHTGDPLYHSDGTPVTEGSHATVVVYPEGASHPVWWDPQQGLTSDHPPAWMVDDSSYVNFTPIEPSGGAHHGGAGNQGTGTGVSGANVADRDIPSATVPERMGGDESPEPRADDDGRGGGPGAPGDRLGDGDHLPVSELVDEDGGGSPHDGQADGRETGPSDLSVPVDDHGAAHSGERADDHLSADGGVTDRSPGTDPTTSADDREAHAPIRPEGLTVEHGDGPRQMGEPSEPGSVAGSGHDSGVGEHDSDRSADDHHEDHEPHTGDHAPSDQNGPADKSRIYSMMDGTSHTTAFAPEQLLDNQRVTDALNRHGVSKSHFVNLINTPTDILTPAERGLLNAVRDDLPAPTRDTVMQKVVPPGYFDDAGNLVQSRADDYIMGNNPGMRVDRVGGAVTFADDTAHLSTPRQIHDGLRLDYTDTPFAPHDPGTHIIRFQQDPSSPGYYEVPRNSDMGGNGTYDTWDDPFTGNGFTKSSTDVNPEYIAKNITMQDGAEMWEVLDDGTQRLVAVLQGKTWIPQGN